MARERTKQQLIREAANHHSDLYIFSAVIALLEGGTVHSPCYEAQAEIVDICKKTVQQCLRRYDAAVEKASRP